MLIEAGALVRFTARRHGSALALAADGGGTYTFAELNELANKIGSGFRTLGVRPGERVGLLGYNVPEMVQAWLAFEKHNIVRVALHTHCDMSTHAATLNHVEASALLFDSRLRHEVEIHRDAFRTVRHFVAMGPDPPDWATTMVDVMAGQPSSEPYMEVDEDAPCFVQLTSGTTGPPKPWVKTYRSWRAVIEHNLHHLDTLRAGEAPIGPGDVNLHFTPIQSGSGFQTLYPYLVRGSPTFLVDDAVFDPKKVIEVLCRHGITGTVSPGLLLVKLLDEVEARGGIDHRLRRLVVRFATPELLERTTKLLGPVWSHGYGSTELGAPVTRLVADECTKWPRRRAGVGTPPSPFVDLIITDEQGNRLPPKDIGRITSRSAMSDGWYWHMPDETRRSVLPGGWFQSSDLGYLDDDGFLVYVDRASDGILTPNGVVHPHLVETALLRHPGIDNVGVVGIGLPGAQEVVAAVVVKSGWSPTPELEETVRTTAASGLQTYECPSRIVFVSELPTSAGGKVVRQSLRKTLADSATQG